MNWHLGDEVLVAVGGSPLYRVGGEHVWGAVALVVYLAGVWRLRHRLADRAPVERLLIVLLGASSAVHAGLALGPGAHAGAERALFALDAAALAFVTERVARGRSAGMLGVAVLGGSIVAYALTTIGGEAPEQVGMLTKLVEVTALAIVARPAPGVSGRPARSIAGSAAVVALVFVTAASAWIGAFRAAGPERGAFAMADHGAVPPPGTVMGAAPRRAASAGEQAAASAFLDAARLALARYTDPAAAAADGYRVEGLAGIDFHATNPAYERDGRVLDPARPETLVYGVTPGGRAVLLGAQFVMPRIGEPGPQIGGPLTVWHAHENICVSLLPPSLSGIMGPFGMCPFGSITVPLTGEMIHIWIVPGAPEPFGDLAAEWKKAYLASGDR